jgi:hypothetical protein
MRPCWNQAPVHSAVSRAGRSRTCRKPLIRRPPTPVSLGPIVQRPVRDSNPSHLFDRQAATPAASQGGRVPGGSRTRLSHPGRVVPLLLGHEHVVGRRTRTGGPSVSAGCSHRPSDTGISQRRRQESNLLEVGLRPTAWPSGPGVVIEQSQRWDSNPLTPRYEGGARPVEHRWRFRVAGGSRTHTSPVHSRLPLPLWVRPQCFDLDSNQESGLRRPV